MNDSSREESLRFAALAAHQLKSPIATVKSLLRTVQGEYVGALTQQQKDLLERAGQRCDQALESVARMMAIARAVEDAAAVERPVDGVDVARRVAVRYAERAAERDLRLAVDLPGEPLWIRMHEAALDEALSSLLDNALKYTPETGELSLSAIHRDDRVLFVVGDSGVGIPEESLEKVFQPFYRTATAKDSSRPGTGLGLSFVKAVTEAAGGTVAAGRSPLGGAELRVDLPLGEAPPEHRAAEEEKRFHVVIVGGVAAGPKVAARVIRLRPDAHVTVVERNEFLSYAGCGLPYYLAGDVKDPRDLMSTGAGALRDAVFFRKMKNVEVLSQTEALRVDVDRRRLGVRDVIDGTERWLPWDRLVFATGARPVSGVLEGEDLDGVFRLHGVKDAEGIKQALGDGRARDVVIVGGGLIGVEVTEALVRSGCRVTIMESHERILPILDPDMALLVERHLESRGVKVLTGCRARAFEGVEGRVRAVRADCGSVLCDFVVWAGGIEPVVELARSAGVEIGPTGAIRVDEAMNTSVEGILAAGDCVESRHIVTGEPVWAPLGSTAHKQARVAAATICEKAERFAGVLGSCVFRAFDHCVGRTGLSLGQARAAGYEAVSVVVAGYDRDTFLEGAGELVLQLVADGPSRRFLGMQVVGNGGGDKRVDVAAAALTAGWTVDELASTCLAYGPPYGQAMDVLLTAANVLRNRLDGLFTGMKAGELRAWQTEGHDLQLVDVRAPEERAGRRIAGALSMPLASLRGRLGELDRNRPVVTFCEVSLKGYEASLVLRDAGFTDVRVLEGGVKAWPYELVE